MGLELYLRCFYELDSCRAIAEGLIPWTAIDQWCSALNMNDEEREDVHYLVQRLDNAYLEHQSSKRPKTGKKGK